jgi:predicted Rossmann fold flavoprotein
LVRTDTGALNSNAVLIATGGKSYPATGSSGDGYELATRLGIRVEPVYSALASLVTQGEFAELSGITVGKTRVSLRIEDSGERSGPPPSETAPFLFAGKSITGRAIINLCGFAGKALLVGGKVAAIVDWLPDQTEPELLAEVADQRMRHGKMHVSNFIAAKSAKRLALLLCSRAGVPEERRLAELSKDETKRLLDILKRTEIEVVSTEPLARATVTGGGVALDEISLYTFESRKHKRLYFAGEVLDVWGRSGGYNLHFAWASGIAVGEAV